MTQSPPGADPHSEQSAAAPDMPSPSTPSRPYERALTLIAMGFHGEATVILRALTASAPRHAPAWETLAQVLRLAGKDEEAREAMSRAAEGSVIWPAAQDKRTPEEIVLAERALMQRVRALNSRGAQVKELRDHLRNHETDAAAIRVLGRLEREGDYLVTGRSLFERALALAPNYDNARAELAILLLGMDENTRAVAESSLLIARAPENIEYRALHANALCAVGDFDAAIPLIEEVMRAKPDNVRTRRVYARSLFIAGRRDDSAREYRACLAMKPDMAEAYGGLADLRGNYLNSDDVAAMRQLLGNGGLDPEDRRTIQYALGYTLEQARDFPESFAAYAAGVALSESIAADSNSTYSPAREAKQLNRRRAVFTPSLLARATPAAKPAATPIFVLGMPRAGSTLVEQILASHSLVEGTMELPVLDNVIRGLNLRRYLANPDSYPECLRDIGPSDLAELGTQYIEECAAYRRSDRPYFIDKQPWNWRDAGFIRMILPHAKIVDIRREPMAACFGMFKLQLEIDSLFPYGFRNLARCYTQYADMMAYYEAAMPGHVHFLSYESLVENTESEIRNLLAYCGLPFEESCLRFWETGRAVATPSGEQVRQPIYRGAMEQWKNYEPWLGPLKEELAEARAAAAGAAPRAS